MTICAIISEFNPFHNGHKYLLEKTVQESGADSVICIMSGNYTQRGEIAVADKYTRAQHAIRAGADAVIELPTVFATASAEFFARGAIKLLSSIPDAKILSFGCEDDNTTLLENTARLLVKEPKGFKKILKEKIKNGISFAKAKTDALSELNGSDISFVNKPNNILALEYAKAIRYYQSDMTLFPVLRVGNEHNDSSLNYHFSSASSIRSNFMQRDKTVVKMLKSVMPDYVYEDLLKVKENNFKQLVVYSLLSHSASELKEILDCTEGLENRFKALLRDTDDYDALLSKMTSKRYTASRLRRIMLSSFLNIDKKLVTSSLVNPLYLKVLAVKQSRAEEMLPALAKSNLPVITRKRDADFLRKTALECFEKDVFANDLYNFTTGTKTNEFYTLFV